MLEHPEILRQAPRGVIVLFVLDSSEGPRLNMNHMGDLFEDDLRAPGRELPAHQPKIRTDGE